MRTYRSAHGLAARGHEVHVFTNAKETRPPFRMHMRAEDWKRCEATYGSGSVTVHWTDPVDRSQSYIPMASPFVSKLAATAARVHAQCPFEVIFSFYMEPFGVAGHLAAQMTGAPHVVRMAGSDAGRLWRHPQFEALYDHVLRSAEVVIAAGPVAGRAVERGIDPDRIAFDGGVVVPDDLFTPDGPALDLAALRNEVEADPELRDLLWGDFAADRPYFGVCGKLGENKGSFALLSAMQQLKREGLEVGLVALAHGQPTVERNFRDQAKELGLVDRILQIPFLPHWRVPEFLRGCAGVCCLEQDFAIGFHTPIIPREVLLCGSCLIGSTEVIRKLPSYARLPHGYGCVAIEDVNDIEALSERLAAIVKDPEPAAVVGARGRAFARDLQREVPFPRALETILEAAVARQRVPPSTRKRGIAAAGEGSHFPLTQLAAAAIEPMGVDRGASGSSVLPGQIIDLARAREVLAIVEKGLIEGRTNLRPLDPAIRIEIAIAAAESEADDARSRAVQDPLFRLRSQRWAMADCDLAELVPLREPLMRVVEFDYDVSEYWNAQTVADFPDFPTPRRSYIVVFGHSDKGQRQPLLVDPLTAEILKLSDGTRTASDIIEKLNHEAGAATEMSQLKWIEDLFVHGLISLQDQRVDQAYELRQPTSGALAE
jgi:glycosyltransferase involved in cell wall biosynthesis